MGIVLGNAHFILVPYLTDAGDSVWAKDTVTGERVLRQPQRSKISKRQCHGLYVRCLPALKGRMDY